MILKTIKYMRIKFLTIMLVLITVTVRVQAEELSQCEKVKCDSIVKKTIITSQ